MAQRRCTVLRGTPTQTAAAALSLTAALAPSEILWVGGEGERIREGTPAVSLEAARSMLGRGFDAVVLDVHTRLDADVLGQCHGFVRGGGALVLRLPSAAEEPRELRARLAVAPHAESAVGVRFFARLLERLEAGAEEPKSADRLPVPDHTLRGTAQQAQLVDALALALNADSPQLHAVLADRGRGKSSALGMALRAAASAGGRPRVAVTAAHEGSVAEIFRFADDAVETGAVFVPPLELAEGATRYDAIVVDEAAQLPVPLLKRLTRRHPDAHMLFATTTRGYEGTGRGFVLRFLEELERNPRPLRVHRLTDPIRFDADDALEALVFDVLCLDARSAEDGAVGQKTPDGIVHRVLGQDEIAGDERLLRDFFGLLVHAHYRTTPSDLHRLLDAPNLRLHSLERDGRVVAACIAAIEGNLAPEICDALYWGRRRVRGHALPETLICHSGESSAGGLSFVRSVRIATHPALRRQGLATRLVAEIHAAYAPDFFGTLFGATAELLEFRRSVGYELVRVGASRGTRTGEPAAVMLRPVSIEARAIFDRQRGVLARDLPELLTLARSDGDLLLDAELEASLLAGLPAPRPLDEDERAQIVQAYAHGPRTFEAAATALASFVAEPSTDTDRLSSVERDLLRARLEQRAPWPAAARAAGFETVPSAMRALRRAVAKLIAE